MNSDVLRQLHDFSEPYPPSWTPQTVGWYVIFALMLGLAVWIGWHTVARWRGNRYRRAAVKELQRAPIGSVPELLKRTALAAFRREDVASLSGSEWLGFLDAHGQGTSFSKEAAHLLLDLEYRETPLTSDEEHSLRELAGDWIRGHRVRV